MFLLDETRRRLHETVCGSALWFDSLFGEVDLEAARAAHGYIEASAAESEFYGTEVRLRARVHVRLPALEQRLSAFVGRDSDEDFVRDRSEGLGLRSQFPRVEDQEEWLAGLGFALPEQHRFKMDFKVGARSLSNPNAFAQLRVGYTAYSDERNLIYLRATPFVNTRDGVGITTSVDLSRVLSDTYLARWGSIGTVSEETEGLDWRSALILYQNLQFSRAAAYEVFARGGTTLAEPLTEYGYRVLYRQPLVANRLFMDLHVGYSWPRHDPALSRDGSFGAGCAFELPFGAGTPR